jgi:signal transduction histidine kinase
VNTPSTLLVASDDTRLFRVIGAACPPELVVARVTTFAEVVRRQEREEPAALVLDITCDDLYRRIDAWRTRFPDTPLIPVGPARSDRILALDRFNLFAALDAEADVQAWQRLLRLVERDYRHRHEALRWRDRAAASPPSDPVAPAPDPVPPRATPSIIAHVAAAFRHFEHLDLMLDRAVEGLATAAHTTRVGLFTFDEAAGVFRMTAGQRTLRETADLRHAADDPLSLWFERHAHMITRTMAGQLPDPEQRRLLTRALEECGAEVMVPLQTHGRLLGWFFVGYRATGQPYDVRDLEELSLAADYLSMLLENATLYREVAMQKSLAETLLHALPSGIVAVDAHGVVRWFSTAAQRMFDRAPGDVTGKPVEVLGPRFADVIRRALQGRPAPSVRAWEEPATRRYLQIEVQSFGGGQQLGVVAVIQDLTAVRRLQEKQAQVERTAFWTDLAAGLSHEIRNPLVTINTFAQLLPERYQDEEFRNEFSTMVTREVARLDGIINQINDFAHPAELVQGRVDVRQSLQAALRRVFPNGPEAAAVHVASRFDGNLPLVRGDERSLSECFTHLLQNAVEAMDGRPGPSISCSARAAAGPGDEPLVEVAIQDNGRGIPAEVLDKVYSPFYTTKARGMGLGLPIVKRTVVDHNGRLSIDSNDHGTNVVIQLPVADESTAGRSP